MYARMCVCMYARMCVCMYARMCVCMCACVCVCFYAFPVRDMLIVHDRYNKQPDLPMIISVNETFITFTHTHNPSIIIIHFIHSSRCHVRSVYNAWFGVL